MVWNLNMIESCTVCGCTIDMGVCLCPDGRPGPATPYRRSTTKLALGYQATIFIAGDLAKAEVACQAFCDAEGECVTVEPAKYVYTGGAEAGVRIGFINYARFPRSPDAIFNRAAQWAQRLIVILGQDSATVLSPDKSLFISCRTAEVEPPAQGIGCQDIDCQDID